MCHLKFYIVILVLLTTSCATSRNLSSLSLNEQEIKDRYLTYVISVKIAQVKFKNTNLDNARSFLEYANNNLSDGYGLNNDEIQYIINYGREMRWEDIIEDKRQFFNPRSPIHRITALLSITDKKNRMPTFDEIKNIAEHASGTYLKNKSVRDANMTTEIEQIRISRKGNLKQFLSEEPYRKLQDSVWIACHRHGKKKSFIKLRKDGAAGYNMTSTNSFNYKDNHNWKIENNILILTWADGYYIEKFDLNSVNGNILKGYRRDKHGSGWGEVELEWIE